MQPYVYDAWGNHKIYDQNGVEIANNEHIANLNPIRYRGYYYDTETNLYYLKTRYYDSSVGRFISPDSVDYLSSDKINGLNLYAYCANNPVMNVDPTGQFNLFIFLFIAVIAMVTAVAIVKEIDKEPLLNDNLFESIEDAVIAWSSIYIQETQNDHKERGALILSKRINDKKYYYLGRTRTGFEGTCWNAFVLGYLFRSGKVEGFIHSHTAYEKSWGWDTIDYGPSSMDILLFGIAGIFRQFIANEQGVLYEFFEDESTKKICTFF